MDRLGLRLAALGVAAALVATVAFAVLTLRVRPPENTEGCLLFEASRIRAGLPLYTDPVRGAYDEGPVPARYHVLYPPLFSSALAMVPTKFAPLVGRTASLLSWYGLLGWLSWSALRRGHPLGAIAGAFVGGLYALTLHAGSARPDALAVALAGFALERCVRAKKAGAAEGALFALAAWLKPNVLGMGAGVMAAALPSVARPLLGFAGTSTALFGALSHASDGQLWSHLASATLQPPSLAQWTEQMASRLPFFALPLGGALYVGYAGRADAGVRIAALALASSTVWTLSSLAKAGSTTAYFLEPCVAAIVVCAHAPPPVLGPRLRTALPFVAALQVLWTGSASVKSSLEAIVGARGQQRALAELRAERGDASRLWLSDDAGVELALDDRLVDTPFQTTELVRQGRFPADVWIGDVDRPEVIGVVVTNDLLERSPGEVDPVHDRYDSTMRRALVERFALARRQAGYFVYVRR